MRAFRGVARRAEAAGVPAVVVTHGGVIKTLLGEALGPDKRYLVDNAAVYRFRIGADRVERAAEFP